MQETIKAALTELLRATEAISSDVGTALEEILHDGMRRPLSANEVRALLSRVVEVVRAGAETRGDSATVAVLDRDAESFLARVEQVRASLLGSSGADDAGPATLANSSPNGKKRLELQSYDGIEPGPVLPAPVFHERRVAVMEGFARTRDLDLWDANERLDIHLNQFRWKYGEGPDAEQLLAIMKGDMPLPGIEGADQFKIRALAKSIAVNGVRKPPILDVDGTLLDGNRRVSACYHILADESGEFTAEEKQRAEWLKIWQLTEHATDRDRDAVVVSLNFEPDYKQDWPDYVKAQKVHAQWEAFLALEPRANPAAARQREIRRDIARKFALSTTEVTRYINMAGLAHEFEDYQILDAAKDRFAAKHRASDRFQYFDELNKGKSPGGVNWSLNQDDSFKHLVFDLLYDGKVKNWQRIRDLKYVYENEDAVGLLRKARDEPDLEAAQEEVDNAISLARAARAERRQTGANPRIRDFTEWFLGLPVKAFDPSEPGSVTPDNLARLRDVLRHVETYLEPDDAGEAPGEGA